MISGLPHEFFHDLLHPHLKANEADAIAPPKPEQVQQVPVRLLQNHLVSVKHSSFTGHTAPVLQTFRDKHILLYTVVMHVVSLYCHTIYVTGVTILFSAIFIY